VHAHEDAQQLGLHRQPAVPLVSLAGFAAGPHVMLSRRQPAPGFYTGSPSRPHQQQGTSTAVVRFLSTTAAVTDLETDSGVGGGVGQAASSGQQPGSSVRHPEQPAGATAAGANAWWDADGCFEYRAPLSTTVRRLKVSSSSARVLELCSTCLARRFAVEHLLGTHHVLSRLGHFLGLPSCGVHVTTSIA
jgi:hypothetical protein